MAHALLGVTALLALAGMQGCGGSAGDKNLRYSPPGSYEWQVTASSISGPVMSQTVTLYVNILPR